MRRLALIGVLCAAAVGIALSSAGSASADRAACEEQEWVNAPEPATACWEEVHREEREAPRVEVERKAEEEPWYERCNELPPSQIEACFYEHNGEKEPSETEGEREVLFANGCAHTNLEFRPRTIGVSCDRTFKFYGIHWKSWGRPEAVGIGRARLQGCTPACANGEVTRPRATIRLTHVVTFQGIWTYGQLTYSLVGRLPKEYRRHHGVLHVLPGSTNTYRRPPMKECPTSGVMDLGQLQAVGMSCAHATRVIGSFMGKSQLQGRGHLRTLGFRCKNVRPGTGPGIICRRGWKMARFLGAPDF